MKSALLLITLASLVSAAQDTTLPSIAVLDLEHPAKYHADPISVLSIGGTYTF